MPGSIIHNTLASMGRYLHGKHMEPLGLRNTMRMAKRFNRLRRGKFHKYRSAQYRDHFDELIRENGAPSLPIIEMKDGLALDSSGKLPYLDEMLREADRIIEERGQIQKKATGSSRSFFQNILERGDLEKYPSILNFVLSSEVLSTVCNYLKTIPILSVTLPPGVRLAESNAKYDNSPPGVFRESQFYHLDHHDRPMAYVIVLLRDVSIQSGPFTYMSQSASARAAKAMNYQSRPVNYRVTDEQMYAAIDKNESHEFTCPCGTVLFIDSSECFHYGSRNAVIPRYQMMYAFTTVCRSDFTELFMDPLKYKTQSSDSQLRRMVLEKDYLA